MNNPLRVALFTDCFYEVNGAAHSCRHLVQYAANNNYPFLSVHCGPRTEILRQGSVTKLELQRGPTTFAVDTDFGCDLLLWRHANQVWQVLQEFQPDLIHVISPGDFSALGAYLGHRLGVPIIASYHTQLHEYAGTRTRRAMAFLPSMLRDPIANLAQFAARHGVTQFYRIPSMLMAPNPELCDWLVQATGRPCRLMGRGVDTVKFSPAWRNASDGILRLGYVGRLTTEKNVRFLQRVEQALTAEGIDNFRFVIVGEGSERAWLRENMRHVELTGVLRGEALSRAYANFDLFVFPSHTDAFGNVVQEALASAVPAVVTNQGGPRFIIDDGITGFAAANDAEFITRVVDLVRGQQLRRRMGAAARAATRNRRWEDVLSTVYHHYQELCETAAAKVAGKVSPGYAGGFAGRKNRAVPYGPLTARQEH